MKRNLVLFSCILLLSASSALAQSAPVYQVTTTPTFVINDGRSEALGSVRITVATASANTFASTIQYNFTNVACDLTDAAFPIAASVAPGPQTGPQLIYSGTGTAITGANLTAITNTSAGCTVSITIGGGLTAVLGDYLELQGVRGRIDISPGAVLATNLTASLSSTPSTSSLFTVPNQGVVGISAHPWKFVGVTQVGSILFCPSPIVNPIFEFKEDFNGAFVQYKDASTDLGVGYTLPADHRPLFGAKNNTQLHIVITGLPSGATLTWDLHSSISAVPSKFTLVSQSASGDTATYEYSTTSQNSSDITLEDFTIGATLSLGANPVAGQATIQAQLYPPLVSTDTASPTQVPYTSGSVASPRFNDPPQPAPGATFLTVAPCTTNLLFPWMAFIPSAGFDTGFAIANTTTDPYGTTAQHGTCALNFFPTVDTTLGTAPTAGTAIPPITTPDVPTGATYAASLSTLPAINVADFTGYMIAVCKFQYGHGFAFITDDATTPSQLAQGYVALIIPDPVINGVRIANDSVIGSANNSGEGLGQ